MFSQILNAKLRRNPMSVIFSTKVSLKLIPVILSKRKWIYDLC